MSGRALAPSERGHFPSGRSNPVKLQRLRKAGTVAAALLTGALLFFSSPGSGGHPLLAWFALVPLLLIIREKSPAHAFLLGLIAGLGYYLPLLSWITAVLGRYGGVHPGVALIALVLLSLYMALYLALFAGLSVIVQQHRIFGRSARLMYGGYTAPGCLPEPAVLLNDYGTLSQQVNGPGKRLRVTASFISRGEQGLGPVVIWALPTVWVGLDVLRGSLFTGFPWQDLGYSQYSLPLLLQTAELTGHHGITFIIVLVNGLAALLLTRVAGFVRRPHPNPSLISGGSKRQNRQAASLAAALLLLCAFLLYGRLSLKEAEEEIALAPRLRAAFIQGNIAQEVKWEPEQQIATVERYLNLSRKALEARPQLVVWPETALPFYPDTHPLFKTITAFARHNRTSLLIGAPHRQIESSGETSYFNSAILVGEESDKEKPPIYHKQHLVPFGEYIPLRKVLPFFAPVVETLGDFTPGPGPVVLNHQGGRLGVLICFEAIFPELARKLTANGADLLINITNDAWFGRSGAPHQHLAMTVLRAVENRRSLVRAANTGISAFITPDGRIWQATRLFTSDQRSFDLPLPRREKGDTPEIEERRQDGKPQIPLTFFNSTGYLFGPTCLLLLIAGIIQQAYVKLVARNRGPDNQN